MRSDGALAEAPQEERPQGVGSCSSLRSLRTLCSFYKGGRRTQGRKPVG